MAVNPYWNNFGNTRTQNLINSLIMESVKIFGYELYYIPRNISNLDQVLGEDPASVFDKVTKFEVYVKNTDGFGGEGNFFQKFGMEVRESVTFYLQKTRFYQARSNKLTMENGFTYQTESSNPFAFQQAIGPDAQESFILDEDPATNPFLVDFEKPREGDLVFFPLANRFFEIMFSDDDEMFHPMGTSPVFTINCEHYMISHEKFQTGVPLVDDTAFEFDGNMLDTSFLLETGFHILSEDGREIIQEEYSIELNDVNANNSVFTNAVEDVVDWSEKSPFIISDGSGKW